MAYVIEEYHKHCWKLVQMIIFVFVCEIFLGGSDDVELRHNSGMLKVNMVKDSKAHLDVRHVRSCNSMFCQKLAFDCVKVSSRSSRVNCIRLGWVQHIVVHKCNL